MYQVPSYYDNFSLKLSEVLADIGLTERLVAKRRKELLLSETIRTIPEKVFSDYTLYMFGSLSEGTTTLGLRSDTDTLFCNHNVNVIQDYSEWKRGYINLMMIKDVNTSPGYCLLQLIRSDLPLPSEDVVTKHYVKVDKHTVLFKNFHGSKISDGTEMNGPAMTAKDRPGLRDFDIVMSFKCKSWPKEASQWLKGDNVDWPIMESKKFAENNGCFVVPVASRVSQNKELEWRISTSLAERSLMFSLNITQLRCYVLMKLVLKTYLNNQNDGLLSSFMCKTILLNCIKNTHSGIWVESNILKCFTYYLQAVLTSILHAHCPHFIIPGNNLMAGKFSAQVKHDLLQKVRHILLDIRQALFGIQTDDLGKRLQIKLNLTQEYVYSIKPAGEISMVISGGSTETVSNTLHTCFEQFAKLLPNNRHYEIRTRIVQYLQLFRHLYKDGRMFERKAISLLAPFMCSTLGSVIAASNIQRNNSLSRIATDWLSLGEKSDVSSGKLKLASVLYSVGDMEGAEILLREMEHYNWAAVESLCNCYAFNNKHGSNLFLEACDFKTISQAIRQNMAFCVRFMRSETNCVPKELQYEMFRSLNDDSLHRSQITDVWMDWVVVDSLPYLYFLQYKVYGRLNRNNEKQKALFNLISATQALNLPHRETALNVLGQCMEQENTIQENTLPYAILCYTWSLRFRPRNNVAKIHICRLLSKLVNNLAV